MKLQLEIFMLTLVQQVPLCDGEFHLLPLCRGGSWTKGLYSAI